MTNELLKAKIERLQDARPLPRRRSSRNGCVERFFRTLKKDLLWGHRVESIDDAVPGTPPVQGNLQPHLDRRAPRLPDPGGRQSGAARAAPGSRMNLRGKCLPDYVSTRFGQLQSEAERCAEVVAAFPRDVSVAIIAHNAMSRQLSRTLAAVLRAGCPTGRLTVVDVASTNGMGAWLQRHHPEVRVLRLDVNNGPNPARNLALRQAETPFVLLIDADVELLPDAVPAMRAVFDEDPAIAMVAPVVVYAARPDTINQARTWIHFLGEASSPARDAPVASLGRAQAEVGSCSGCAPLIRRAAVEHVGDYDENLFFGKDDGEFAYRLTLGGWRIMETAAARVLHWREPRGSMYYDHQLCNRWYFLLKCLQARTLIAALPMLVLHELALIAFVVVAGCPASWPRGLAMLIRKAPGLAAGRTQVRRLRVRHDFELLRGDHMIVPLGPSMSPALAAAAAGYVALARRFWTIIDWALRSLSRPQVAPRAVDGAPPSLARGGGRRVRTEL
ncbi:MAG: glycosyl transferase family 2 [Thermomicrobiales bacterium]|nr:glycosyl transferase family 2 [Thermomicrobiales bacterium]